MKAIKFIWLASGILVAGMAFAQSGHFVTGGSNKPVCTDIGTQLQCSGKVAGLGGTEFEVTVTAEGTAVVECENPGGNVAPGQDTSVTAEGTTGPVPTPKNGNYKFSLATVSPTVPNYPTCPNPQWTAHVVDVIFSGEATMTLTEDGVVSDVVTVAID